MDCLPEWFFEEKAITRPVVDSRKVFVFIVVFLSLLVEMDCAGFPWFDGIRESQIGLPLQVKLQCLRNDWRWAVGRLRATRFSKAAECLDFSARPAEPIVTPPD
jgi:hypothetical protein